jgi:Cft2 family RNA processing exonuclease
LKLQGTLARELLSSPKEVLGSDGRMLKVRCAVSSFSFSAHADYSQTSHFIETLAPAHVVLCHGNTNEMERLKKGLEKQAKEEGADRLIHAPAVRIHASVFSSTYMHAPCSNIPMHEVAQHGVGSCGVGSAF